jgi:glycosyltransferase involved in cell wall biosynthesis
MEKPHPYDQLMKQRETFRTHSESIRLTHLVFLHPHFTLPGGAGNLVLEEATRLRRDRYRVTILCIRVFPEFKKRYPGLTFIETGGYLPSQLPFWITYPLLQKKINQILKSLNPDILLPSVFPANWWAFPYRICHKEVYCFWYCQEPSAFIHYGEWRDAIEDPLMRLSTRIFQPLLKTVDIRLQSLGADRVICNSLFSMEQFRRKYHREPVGFLHPGVDMDYFRAVEEKGDYLFTVSRLTRFKNIRTAVEAIALLKRQDIRFLIGGDGEEKENLQRLIDRLGLGERVKLTGKISFADLPRLYGKAKILLFPSVNEPFGLVPVEALACGTPVIASNSGGVRDTVRSGFNGILLDRMTPGNLANAIDNLLNNPVHYSMLQRNARKSVEDFSWDRHVDRLDRILEDIVMGLPLVMRKNSSVSTATTAG